jgi:hypothetical protein
MISVLVIQFLDKAAFATDFETNEKIRHGMETNAVLPPMRSARLRVPFNFQKC